MPGLGEGSCGPDRSTVQTPNETLLLLACCLFLIAAACQIRLSGLYRLFCHGSFGCSPLKRSSKSFGAVSATGAVWSTTSSSSLNNSPMPAPLSALEGMPPVSGGSSAAGALACFSAASASPAGALASFSAVSTSSAGALASFSAVSTSSAGALASFSAVSISSPSSLQTQR